MQLTLHVARRTPRGASRLVHAMSAWSGKARRAPSRHHRDARVYGLESTVMHAMSTPPLPPPPRLLRQPRLPRAAHAVIALFSDCPFETSRSRGVDKKGGT